MAYQAAPRYHVSDVQSPEDEDLLEEELAGVGRPNSRVKRWTAASVALLLVAGTLVVATCALNRYRTATRKENSGGNSLHTVNFEAETLRTCMACVTRGRSWQMGTCNPTRECLMVDQACYEDANGCNEWQEQVGAGNVCKAQTDCTSCVSSNRLCLWSDGAGCLMGADFWGPEHLVVRYGETCSVSPTTAEITTAAEPEHGLSSNGTAPTTAKITTTAEPKLGSSSDGFLKPSREPLAECMACVGMGKSWQAGECNPSSECMIVDIGCFQDDSGCRLWHEEYEAASKCEAQKDCSSCLWSSNLCMWRPHSGCFVGSSFFWGPPEAMLRQGAKCPENVAAPLEMAEALKEPALMDVKESEKLTRGMPAGS